MECKSKIKVSVIVPVYNAEKYLECLIDSLLAQTLKSMEFIFVNDGSKDNSLDILKKYALKDQRIIVIDKENAGVSAARNDGLRCAKGEFVGFADADDLVAENMFEVMYQRAATENADIVSCGYAYYPAGKDTAMFDELDVVLEHKTAIEKLLSNEVLGMAVWNKLYRREILRDVTFSENYKVNEDRLFSFMTLKDANKIVVIKDVLYYYRINDESVTRSGFKLIKLDALYVAKEMHSIIEKEYPELCINSCACIACSAYNVLVAMYRDNACKKFSSEHKKLVSEIKNVDLKLIKKHLTRSVYIQLIGVKYCEHILRIAKRFILSIKKN